MSQALTMPADKQVHLNLPQLRAVGIDAHTQVHVWGRRTGKTEGPGGTYTARRVHDMPRANGVLMGTTYEQLLTRTIPPLIAAWEKLGYYQNVHYWIGKAPPAGLRIPKAYRTPLKYDNYVTWYNGSGQYLVSQDRPGSINGVSTQWLYGDEAKFLDVQRLREEALLTLSGLADLYGDLPHYLSTCFMSDAPTGPKGHWLYEFEPLMNAEACELVMQLAVEESRLLQQLELANVGQARRLKRELGPVQQGLAQLRKGLVHYSTATTLDNVHVLGLEPIRRFRRDLPADVFDSSVMNKRKVQVANGFYGLLSEDVHGYHEFDYTHIDRLEPSARVGAEKDSRWDGDVDPRQPLEIALDYNNIFNSLVVGQPVRRDYRLVNSLFVDAPLLLEDVVKKFCHYYRHHKAKHVTYYFDHTAVALDASRNLSYADLVCKVLYDHGWTVDKQYYGHAGSHYARYLLWGKLFQGNTPELPRFRFNLTNAQQWMVSAQGAGTVRKGETWGKDKSGEKVVRGVPVMPPRDATHLSEAGDMLVWGALRKRLSELNDTFADTV